MKTATLLSLSLAIAAHQTQSFHPQLQGCPRTRRRSPIRQGSISRDPYRAESHSDRIPALGAGFAPQDNWSDVKPNPAEPDGKQPPSQSKLTPLESAWTKYGLIAYVAHMCAFLPLSLIPTYVQTQLGVLSKSESEHRALQAGQKCARTLLRWIPFMNVGELILSSLPLILDVRIS